MYATTKVAEMFILTHMQRKETRGEAQCMWAGSIWYTTTPIRMPRISVLMPSRPLPPQPIRGHRARCPPITAHLWVHRRPIFSESSIPMRLPGPSTSPSRNRFRKVLPPMLDTLMTIWCKKYLINYSKYIFRVFKNIFIYI